MSSVCKFTKKMWEEENAEVQRLKKHNLTYKHDQIQTHEATSTVFVHVIFLNLEHELPVV